MPRFRRPTIGCSVDRCCRTEIGRPRVVGMTPLLSALSIAAALLVGAISPGPSFVYVSQTALATSRRHGVSAAAGMGLGGAVFASLALLGLVALLHEVTWLYLLSKIAGGLYLLMLA